MMLQDQKIEENETFCRNCGTCVTDAHCGFCFDKAPQHNATCLPLPKELQFQEFGLLEQDLSYSNFSSFSGGFECGNSTTDSGWELITKFCPTKFAWMSTFGLIIYLAFFAPGTILSLSQQSNVNFFLFITSLSQMPLFIPLFNFHISCIQNEVGHDIYIVFFIN